MKNLLLILVLSLATSLSFANNLQPDKIQATCVHVITSCGIHGMACGNEVDDIIEMAIELDDMVC
jgi:hypothetical protein